MRLRLPGGTSACVTAFAEHAMPMVWADLFERPRPVANHRLAYGAGPLQFVDLWVPSTAPPHPALIMIHGGCWLTDVADCSIMNWIAADLRASGIAVWNIEYRGVDRPGGGYPGTYQDVALAADMFRDSGAQWHLCTEPLVVTGHSAGGHLALWLADRFALPARHRLRGRNPARIDHVISLGGLPDLERLSLDSGHGCGTAGAIGMAGLLSEGRTGLYSDTSPIAMAPGPARRTQINASLDAIAPPDFAAAYTVSCASNHVHVEDIMITGEGHVELIAPESASWAATKHVIARALGTR